MDARKNRFLGDFSSEGREKLIGHLIYQELVDGEFLFHQGDSAQGVCLVLEGQVEILRTSKGHEKIFTVVKAGDFLGEVAVLDGQGRSTDARAKGAVCIAWIPTPDLLEVLLNEPVGLTLNLFQNVLSILRKTDDLYIKETVQKEKLSLIGEMASSLMHDLRNPVTGIHLAADLITMIHTDEETVDSCDKIRLQCDRLMAMATELLEFSRGETKLKPQRTDTTTLTRQFLSFNEDTFRTSGVNVTVEDEPAEIEVDLLRLLRVLQNLVSNAIDALRNLSGGEVQVRAWVRDSIFYLSVKDNGPGIPPEIQERLFDPFVTHGKVGGTGLGLAIVKNVVTAHRGKITFESKPGHGTEFLIRLPQDAMSKPVL